MEFLSKEVFKAAMKNLEEVYNYTTTKKQMELYYKYLKDAFSDDDFELACASIILDERFFPAVSVFISHKPQELWQQAH
jgi:hypothetical protein